MPPQSNREELAARLKECTVSGDAAGLLGFVCAGRGSSLYGEAGVESKVSHCPDWSRQRGLEASGLVQYQRQCHLVLHPQIITEVFPSLPFSGMFAGGELGPPAHYEVVDSSEPSSLMGFTSVYCHLALHKGRRPAQ